MSTALVQNVQGNNYNYNLTTNLYNMQGSQ